jgi:hypothetical protein
MPFAAEPEAADDGGAFCGGAYLRDEDEPSDDELVIGGVGPYRSSIALSGEGSPVPAE